MDKNKMLATIQRLIDDARAAVLCTTGKNSEPYARWMTPVLASQRESKIYCFATPDSRKIAQIKNNPAAHWLLQSKDLTEVVNITGRCEIIDNPALRSEMLEILGLRLSAFWRANPQSENFIVLETTIESAEYMKPMAGKRETVKFV
jgi:pyridoxamine 5'-phosphate oxidase